MLKLYSLQRRRDRYTIIYVWKILESIVPNLNIPIWLLHAIVQLEEVDYVQLPMACRNRASRYLSLV